MGVFGGYTSWAVVFLIIFVLFFLLCPGYNGYTGGHHVGSSHVAVTTYGTSYPMGTVAMPQMGSSPYQSMKDYGSSPSSI